MNKTRPEYIYIYIYICATRSQVDCRAMPAAAEWPQVTEFPDPHFYQNLNRWLDCTPGLTLGRPTHLCHGGGEWRRINHPSHAMEERATARRGQRLFGMREIRDFNITQARRHCRLTRYNVFMCFVLINYLLSAAEPCLGLPQLSFFLPTILSFMTPAVTPKHYVFDVSGGFLVCLWGYVGMGRI